MLLWKTRQIANYNKKQERQQKKVFVVALRKREAYINFELFHHHFKHRSCVGAELSENERFAVVFLTSKICF